MQLAVVCRVENFFPSVAIDIHNNRIGHTAFDHVVILADGSSEVRRDNFPVETVLIETASVGVEDENPLIKAGVGICSAVIDVACNDYFRNAVVVYIRNRCRRVGKIRPMFNPAVDIAPQFGGQVHCDADITPCLAAVHGIRLHLNSRWFVCTDVMDIGGNDYLRFTVAIDIPDCRIAVIHTPCVSRVIAQLRPAGADAAVESEHPGVGLAAIRGRDDDLHLTVIIDVGYGQSPEFIYRYMLRPARLEITAGVVNGYIASAMSGDYLE